MSDRCLQPDHSADPTVFGACPCGQPEPQRVFPRFVPSSAFVVPGVLDPVERPYETTLSPDELED